MYDGQGPNKQSSQHGCELFTCWLCSKCFPHGCVAWIEPGLPFQDRSSRRHTFLICKVKVLRPSCQCAFFRRWRSGFTCTEEWNGTLGRSISMLNASLSQHHPQFVKIYLMGLTNWSVNGCFLEKLKALLISSTAYRRDGVDRLTY